MRRSYIPKRKDLFPNWGADDCEHDWDEMVVEVGPPSAETWGPQLAEILDTSAGELIKEHLDDLVLSEAQAEELRTSMKMRFCHNCGLMEEE